MLRPLTSWAIYRTARRVFGETVAVWSGWIWALLPYIIYWSVRWIWETSLTALLLTVAFMLTVEMEGDDRITSWIGYGVLWGVIGLTNPSRLSFLPFAGCWLAYQLYRRGKPFVLPADRWAVLFWMTMMPWLVRNYEVFHKPVFRARQRGSRNPLRQQSSGRRHHGWACTIPARTRSSFANIRRWARPPTRPSSRAWPNSGLPRIQSSSPSSPSANSSSIGTACRDSPRSRRWSSSRTHFSWPPPCSPSPGSCLPFAIASMASSCSPAC